MKVCIHRGTKEIGGSCVEFESNGQRILVDLGLPLDSDESPESLLPGINGLDGNDPSLAGIFISHSHLDHYGLLSQVSKKVPVGMGAAGRRILKAAAPFMRNAAAQPASGWDLKHRESIKVGPFLITPFLMDHSAYDAYALLIEADGKKVLYSGDFRGHGRKAALLDELIQNPPEHIDTLLLEGSSLGRLETDQQFPAEKDLEQMFITQFSKTMGLCMVHTSAQNIDRIVTIFRACLQSERTLILDLYASAVLAATENAKIPQSDWDQISLFIPQSQRVYIKNNKLFDLLEIHSANRIFPENLASDPGKYVILFRPLHKYDLQSNKCLADSVYIYSQWEGYWERGAYDRTKTWLKKHHIPKVSIHTSGHACIPDLKKLVEGLKPGSIVPIHSFSPEKYETLYKNVVQHNDGEWWEVS